MFANFWRYRSLVFELVKRDFSGRYQGSFGGVVWSFVQPLFLLTVYTIAFGVILKARWGFAGSTSDYALILFAGLIVFNAFSEMLSKSSTLVTNMIGIAVWLLGYTLLIGMPKEAMLLFPLVLFCFVPVLLGLGWLLSSVGVVVRDISQLTAMLNHTLLFLTPIFYSIEAAPPLLQKLLMINPLTFVVEQFRLVLFYGQMPALRGLALYFVMASVFAGLSLRLFRRLRPSFADMV